MAYQQQQPVQRSDGGPAYYIKLMARIEEKIAVICNIGRSASTTREVMMGEGNGNASVTLFTFTFGPGPTFTKLPGPHADTAWAVVG